MRALALALLALFGPVPASSALPTLPSARPAIPVSSRPLVQQRTSVATASAAALSVPPRSWVEDALVATTEAAGAMPFLRVDPSNHTLTMEPAAYQALASLPAPLCVLSVAGAAHEGKSSLLNMFSHWVTERWATVQGAGADFKVAVPECTARTSAPRRRIRKTFRAWRSMSSAPM